MSSAAVETLPKSNQGKPAKVLRSNLGKESSNVSKQEKSKKKDGDEQYKSEALSKKDRRKLKKKQQEKGNTLQEEDSEGEESSSEKEGEQNETLEERANGGLDLGKLEASESESEDDIGENDKSNYDQKGKQESTKENGEEEEEDIPLSDVEADSDADIVPHSKLSINKIGAINESLARICLPWEKHSFYEHMSVVSSSKAEDSIKDIYDDTQRELAFYKQGLNAVKYAREAFLKIKMPFSRPLDYFAEMVKSDEHMEKLKTKLLTEAANKKASEEAKRQRKLKKFGKQVQVATLQDRAKQKKETMEKIKTLSKKRGSASGLKDDQFDVALEDAINDNPQANDRKRQKSNPKRVAKNSKYGFGGKKSGKKANDADSSANIGGMSKKSKTRGNSRPGKSKRSRK